MKRPLIATLIVGVFVVVAIGAAHLSLQVLQFEQRAAEFISPYSQATRVVGKPWQYVFMSILAFGVAALTVTSLRRSRIGLVAIGLLIELAAVKKYSHQRVALPLFFPPSKEALQNPATATW